MNDDMGENFPVFGDRVDGALYVPRPGAYAVVCDERGLIAVLHTPLGAFLPGGGIEPGEEPADAARREVMEECGLVVHVGAEVARATELVYASGEDTYFEKIGRFFEAHARDQEPIASEEDHMLVWTPIEQALTELAHESHRWAVAQAMCAGTAG